MTVTEPAVRTRTRTMRVPRSRGAVSGLLLILLGAWGALIPFIGPYLDYSYGTDQAWHWTAARGWLEVLPGVVAAVGGLLLMVSANRIRASFGGWLAALAGAWFVVGQTLAPLLRLGDVGHPLSQHKVGRAVAQLGYFDGLGVVILFLGAFALGRLAVVGVRDVLAAERDEARAAELARSEELANRHAVPAGAVPAGAVPAGAVPAGAAAGATAAGVAGERRMHDREPVRDRIAEERAAHDGVADDRLADHRVTGDRTVEDGVAADETRHLHRDAEPMTDGRVPGTGRDDIARHDTARHDTARYEPTVPYGTEAEPAEPARTESEIGSDYATDYGRSPAHHAADERR